MTSQAVEARVERAASTTGRAPDTVERLPFDLSVIEGEGVFVNVDARGFGILDRKLDWTTLGVEIPKGAVAFRAPSAGLLPDVHRLALIRPADQAHAALRKYSYHFSLTETLFESPAYRWIPWRAFEAFERDFKLAQDVLDAARFDAIHQYPALCDQVGAAYRALAEDSGRRLRATGQSVPDNFADLVVAGVLTAMPTPEELTETLQLRYRIGVMMLGSEMLAEQRKAVEERAALSDAETLVNLERQTAYAQARTEQAKLFAEQETIEYNAYLAKQDAIKEAAMKERLRGLKIEAAVKGAILDAYMDGARAVDGVDVLGRVKSIRPTSEVKKEDIDELRKWAREHLAIDVATPAASGERRLEF